MRKYVYGLLALLFALVLGSMSLANVSGGGTLAATSPDAPAGGSEPLPPGATIETLLSGMNLPVSMAFDPAGRLFYTEKVTGNVRLFENGVLQSTPVINFSVNGNFERGLLGIAIDPDFNNNHYIYVYYTCNCTPSENKVVRFVENNGVGSDPVTIFSSTQTAGNHVGGNIHFGPDDKLYITIGDNANSANSQNVTVKNGKMHRINSDGTIPSDNPVFTQTGALPSLYAFGLRNSFDFDFDPLTPGRIFASENGPGCDDEMNRIEAGYNYGWRSSYPCDDNNPSVQYNTIRPLWYLGTGVNPCCEAPTGLLVYSGWQIPQWTNHMFMAAYNSGSLYHFYLDADRRVVTTTNIVLGVTNNTDLETGPDGAFWYIQGGGYSPGTLKRIVGPGPTFTPTSTGGATNTRTNTPAVTFTHTGTRTGTPTNTPVFTTIATPSSTFTATPAETLTPTPNTEPLPPGTSVQTVLAGMDQPVAFAFDPQGRIFYTEKNGRVRLFAGGQLQASPVITFSAYTDGELGLLGLAIDPNFNANHYIYVYYTCGVSAGCSSMENRVVRFVENNGSGSNPTTIFSSPQSAPIHAGGNVHFGLDGKLYITIGDNANAANSQDVTAKPGKLHRINSDGTIPSDNPVFTQTGALPSLYAMGLRNTFDFDFDPLTPGRIFASENGPGCDDEMNRIEPAYNYGWRFDYQCNSGPPDPTYNTIPPMWYMPLGVCCSIPTGVTVYTGHQIPQWRNQLLMANYNGSLMHFYLDATRRTVTSAAIVRGVTTTLGLETGPDGALYYMEGGGYGPGAIKRIVGPGPTLTPTRTGTVAVTRTSTTTPCPMNFSDVQPSDFFYEHVRCLYCRGAISGYKDGTFRPYSNTTRGQMCKIVVLGFDLPINTQGGPHFTDVPEGHTFYDFIETAANAGIVSGYSDNTFRPGNNVTRGQLCKIVVSAAVIVNGWKLICPETSSFSDVPRGDPFYCYVETAACHGIISGYGDGTFRPGNTATRAQIAKIVCLAVRDEGVCAPPTPTAGARP